MSSIALRAHFDGEKIVLDEAFALEPNTKLIVTVLTAEQEDADRAYWLQLSANGLSCAYGDDEPEYDISRVKEANPDYVGPGYAGR